MPAISTSRGPDLSWLADAPVFIDSQQIGAFYDAVVGPAFKTAQLQVTASQTEWLTRKTGSAPWPREPDSRARTTSARARG